MTQPPKNPHGILLDANGQPPRGPTPATPAKRAEWAAIQQAVIGIDLAMSVPAPGIARIATKHPMEIAWKSVDLPISHLVKFVATILVNDATTITHG